MNTRPPAAAQGTTGPGRAPLIELRGISKSFPGVRALDDVALAVHGGEIHMLLGENGAGKSTLIKVLCGAVRPDAGTFLRDGVPLRIASPADARRVGIAVIFQEFSLVPYLSVAQNIYLGRAPPGRLPGTVDRRRMLAASRLVLDEIGCDIDPAVKVHRLGVAQQQLVEIAKALSQDARILVMDEPTAALSDREAERLFAMMRWLKQRGVGIVYISHRMAEVLALGDRITVLRDGRHVRTLLPHEATVQELVRLMVGRPLTATYPRRFRTPGAVILEVRNLGSARGIEGIDLTVREGEIVGLCGLVGSGRTEVARAIFGADRVTAGQVRVFGRLHAGGPERAVRHGMALIPENRKTEGLALIQSVGDNLLAAALPRVFPRGWYVPARARDVAAAMVQRLHIATASLALPALTLSGGNQQKVAIGKWLAAEARLFIFDEPTRGIDIGAKTQIFALIDEVVLHGAGVLMISSEQSEIVQVCDRAYVMRDGRIRGELARAALSEEAIVRMGMHDA
jgi:ribose transport system ATP-binding protein